jgi:CheY-like chemotaxis protein
VLLAEDDEVNALLAVKSLEKAGALIDWAKDGAEAVALVEEVLSGQRPGYDLVLMDLRMPRLNGLEATRRIRLLETAAGRPAPLRIAALTATTMRQDRLDAQAAGMNLFLSKPYNASALIQLLDSTEGDRARAAG